MFVLGITGPSGAGKGTACEILKQIGFYHIDTDRLVPLVYPEAIPALVQAFGELILQNGQVDKKALAKAAFSSPEGTAKLNSILHPLVMNLVSKEVQRAEELGYTRVTVDGAALREAHAETVCHKILCILAPRGVRKSRVMVRDSITEEQADLRLSAQKSDESYVEYADAVIYNRTVDQLRRDLLHLIKEWES